MTSRTFAPWTRQCQMDPDGDCCGEFSNRAQKGLLPARNLSSVAIQQKLVEAAC
jgi:hypothetical protein